MPLKEQRNFNKELLDTALLIIAGGSNSGNDFTGDSTDAEATRILAQTTGSVAVLLNQVPNGRITFEEDTAFPGGRSGNGCKEIMLQSQAGNFPGKNTKKVGKLSTPTKIIHTQPNFISFRINLVQINILTNCFNQRVE